VNKKDKKKKKNVFADFEETKEEPAPTPAAEEPAADEDWGGWGTAKIKKKGKKAVEPDPPKIEEVKAVETAAAEDEWAFGASKKDKKKKGKHAITEVGDVRDFNHITFVSSSRCKLYYVARGLESDLES
jgi:hypothetical protein